MKLLNAMFLIVSMAGYAQSSGDVVDLKKHKIVMQFSDGDSLSQVSIVGQVRNIKTAWPNAQIEVVCHGSGLNLLISEKSKAAKGVADWSNQGVTFAACNNTMKRQNLKKDDLLKASQVVPSAMIELTLKQEDGWAYVKGGH